MKRSLISKSALVFGAVALCSSLALAQPMGRSGGNGDSRPAGGPGGGGSTAFHGPQDTDGDGLISQEEFLVPAQERFQKQDTDGDGVITFDEISAHAKEHFLKLDSNGDGVLSQDELPKGGSRNSKPSDAPPDA